MGGWVCVFVCVLGGAINEICLSIHAALRAHKPESSYNNTYYCTCTKANRASRYQAYNKFYFTAKSLKTFDKMRCVCRMRMFDGRRWCVQCADFLPKLLLESFEHCRNVSALMDAKFTMSNLFNGALRISSETKWWPHRDFCSNYWTKAMIYRAYSRNSGQKALKKEGRRSHCFCSEMLQTVEGGFSFVHP